jgi:cysteine desulfurase
MSYLDCNGTTPLDPLVWEEMAPYLLDKTGNPSSPHALGRKAREALIEAKDVLLSVLKTSRVEVLFTSSATEALNTALFSLKAGERVVSSPIEHSAILEPLKVLKKRGVQVDFLNLEPGKGSWSLESLRSTLEKGVDLVALSAANHETGVLQPYLEAAELCAQYDVPLLLDAVGILGRAPFQFPEGKVGVVISGHKIYGPKGCGALIYHKKFPLTPLLYGGKQQLGKRGGTENVPAVVGLKMAVELMPTNDGLLEIKKMRDAFENQLAKIAPIKIVGVDEKRVVNTSNIIFTDVDAEWLFMQLDLHQVYASFGSACSSNGREPSHVLTAMGYSFIEVGSALRFSIGRMTIQKEIDHALCVFKKQLVS